MLLSFKTALIPNNKQETLFRKASGVARHAYNWGNAYIKEVLELREQDKSIKIPTAIDLHKKLVAEVKSQHDWYYEVNKNVPQKALADCRVAWDRCFKKTSKQPRFKKKGQRDSFYLESGTKAVPKIQNDGKRIKLPSIGWVKLAEPSSQICSNCGQHRHKMPLKNRVYVCPECGHIEDRDLNAAKNIERWFEGIFIPSRSDLAVSSTVSACGVDKPLKNHLETTMNQEVNAEDDTWFWTAEETDALWFWSASSTIV